MGTTDAPVMFSMADNLWKEGKAENAFPSLFA